MFRCITILLLAACLACAGVPGAASEPLVFAPQSANSKSHDPQDLQLRIHQLEASLHRVQQQLDDLTDAGAQHPQGTIDPTLPAFCRSTSFLEDEGKFSSEVELANHCPPAPQNRYFVEYDQGWLLRPARPDQSPFSLKFNSQTQFRYTGYANASDSFTDRAGVTTPINSRNDFDINRGRLIFSGYAFNPETKFFTNIDYNSVSARQVQLLQAYLQHDFSPSFEIRYGITKVPGTWEWQESSRVTLGAERTMATTFFRPSMTAGIWARGDLTDALHYEAMVGDGFNTFTLNAAQLDSNFAYSTMLWWEPLGKYEAGFSDFEQHESKVVRLGHAFTYTRNEADPTGEPGPEQTVIRLSDGTRLVDPGALAPGVTVNQFDILLYAAHLGFKHRGASISLEYYLRWLSELQGSAPLPFDNIFDHGFYVQAGRFWLPKKLEFYGLGSYVTGEFGDGSEIGGGLNWYVHESRNWRMTFDTVHLSTPPTVQSRTGLQVGGSGLLFRVQSWMYF